MSRSFLVLVICLAAAACGPANKRNEACTGADCNTGTCSAGETRECYPGPMETKDVGPCTAGMQSCTAGGTWGDCEGAVVPVAENCGDGIDNNCNGAVDDDVDADGDGYTTCGGDCCDSFECSEPGLVNPGAFDAAGNGLDDDCNGTIDDTLLLCDQGLQSNSQDAFDFAKAIDICQTATMADKKWGVISAKLVLPDGTGSPDPNEYSIRGHFGAGVLPQGGLNMALISSGAAAGKGDTNPAYHDWVSYQGTKTSGFPADFIAAHGGSLPNSPGCPEPNGSTANDPVMLELQVRVPTNAHSFSLKANFFSAEFPEWTCSPYNDFFVVLLDSAYAGAQPNPTDKNLAFYTPPGTSNVVPVGVNLAAGDTGLFTQCVNGQLGCDYPSSGAGNISTCIGTDQLAQTGFDDAEAFACDQNSLTGGGTGWLTTSGNVNPGEIIKLRIAIWDTSDNAWDSLAAIDGFKWSVDLAQPGTVIGKDGPFGIQGPPRNMLEVH